MKASMISVLNLLCLATAAAFLLSAPVFAQDAQIQAPSNPAQPGNADNVLELQRLIEAQQRQLDAQRDQLEAQEKKLQELRQQVQGLAEGATPPEAPVGEKSSATPSGGAAPRRTDTQTTRRDKAHPHDDWKGSFGVEGLNTRFKIGGFVELDVIHDTNAIATPGEFVTSAIVTGDATKAEGSDGQTSFSVNPTRLYVETRTPVKQGRLTTFLSMDFFGDSTSTGPAPRMRQAYGELSNILFGGDLLVGQAWSTFSDLEAWPNVLDFQGPNSFFGTRQPLVRWTRGVADGLKLMVAAETPDNHIIQGADALTAWPDGVLSMVWDHAPVQMMGSVIARDLRASFNNGPTETAIGWGAGISGKLGIPFLVEKDFLTFSVTYGEGIGSGFNDAPPDAVFDSAGANLDAIPVFGWFVSYEHWWSRQFTSTFVYGALDADNRAAQPPDSFDKTQYTSANLVWMPTERWLFGVEGLWGKRVDKDGAEGTDFRTQFTGRFTF
ncbi:MAG: hypothetical protein KAS94_05165 [Desulfobulbaceae bacterium]|jgi:hypothetical protein|nr:hypothetical protein [Desulfobulbaceae bacterium]